MNQTDNTTAQAALEACPWCAVVPPVPVARPGVWRKHYRVQCGTLNCYSNSDGVSFDTVGAAIAFWNTRIPTASAAPTVDQTQKAVYPKDVMEALEKTFDSLKGQRLPISEVGLAIYRGLASVPEFYVATSTLAPIEQSDDAEDNAWEHQSTINAIAYEFMRLFCFTQKDGKTLDEIRPFFDAAREIVTRTFPVLYGTEIAAVYGFCGKANVDVKALIEAPVGYICEECVAICGSIVKRNDLAALQDEAETDSEVTYPCVVDEKTLFACLQTAEQTFRKPDEPIRLERFRRTKVKLYAQARASHAATKPSGAREAAEEIGKWAYPLTDGNRAAIARYTNEALTIISRHFPAAPVAHRCPHFMPKGEDSGGAYNALVIQDVTNDLLDGWTKDRLSTKPRSWYSLLIKDLIQRIANLRIMLSNAATTTPAVTEDRETLLTTAMTRIAEVAIAGERATTGDAQERFRWIRERAQHFAVTEEPK